MGFTLWNYDQFFKNCQAKTKTVVRGYVRSMYTMSDGKNKLLLHSYTDMKR